ncbi:UPF0056 membrane protein [Nocardioides phosphati]|uniref:UPF0056 membrane protein n=1 Tax=Nocardioides phosphati TaxID=1867775 RepID=A0ABQ2N6B8_9ACTN|nr:MarC family protein [Nocardioides phosphati]GGO84808.1 UPF0056 membrane protein [Nocardioides phosphati]
MSSVLDVVLLTEVFVTLFVIMDPPGTIPVFLALTSGRSPQAVRRAAWQAPSVALLVITVFAVFGQQILEYMHITLPALQCSGGLLLLLVALELLMGGEDSALTGNKEQNVALVPLGTPLLAGPGAIVATMLFVKEIDSVPSFAAVALGIIGVHLCIYAAMRFSVPIMRVLRPSGVLLVTRISGLLLAAIAVQMVADAVRAFVRA